MDYQLYLSRFLSIYTKRRWLFRSIIGLILVSSHFLLQQFLPVFPNEGIVFGIAFPGSEIVTVAALAIVYFLYLRATELAEVYFYLLLAGVVNLTDRLRLGYVSDYWQIAGIWFNLADILIIISIAAIMSGEVYAYLNRRQK